MPESMHRVYLDTSVFLAVFNQERHLEDEFGRNRFEASYDVIKQGSKSNTEIYTSVITMSECPEEFSKSGASIEDFFEQEWIHIVEVDRFIINESRTIQRESLIKIKPMDSIHIATSSMIGTIDSIFSYDAGFLKAAQSLFPNIRACNPCLHWATSSLKYNDD